MREIFEKFDHIRYVCVLTQQNTINTLPLDDLFNDLSPEETQLLKEKLEVKYICTQFAIKQKWDVGFQQVITEKYSNNLEKIVKYNTILFEDKGKKIVQELAQFQDSSDLAISKSALIINIGGGQKQHAIGLYSSATEFAIKEEVRTTLEPRDDNSNLPKGELKFKPTIIICYPDATRSQRITTWEYLFDSASQQLAINSLEKTVFSKKFNSSLKVTDICNLHFNRRNISKDISFDHDVKTSLTELSLVASLLDYPELRKYYFMRMDASSRYTNFKNKRKWTEEVTLEDAMEKIRHRKESIWKVWKKGKKVTKYSFQEDINNKTITIQTQGKNPHQIFYNLIDAFFNNTWSKTWANLYFEKIPFQFYEVSPPGFALPSGSFDLDTHDYKTLFKASPDLLNNAKGLGGYFELLVLKKLYLFKKLNPNNLIKEILYGFKITIGGKGLFEFDIAISTTYGSLIIIECKSNKFLRQAASAAIKKAQDIGGIYVEYICVIPSVGQESEKEEGTHIKVARSIWNNHESLSPFRKETYYLKNKGDSDMKELDKHSMKSFEMFLTNNLLP